MITIQTYREGYGRTAEAEAQDPESAVYAARVLFDEALDMRLTQGARKSITTVFLVDGKAVRTITGKRP